MTTKEYFDYIVKQIHSTGYYVTEQCIGCGSCLSVCPQNCIETDGIHHVIRQEHCLHCGNCLNACSVGAVERW